MLNVDVTVICEQPQIGPHRAEIESNLSEVLSAKVSVKASSNEGMGFIGRGEGIACVAVAADREQLVGRPIRLRRVDVPETAREFVRNPLGTASDAAFQAKVLRDVGILRPSGPRQRGPHR